MAGTVVTSMKARARIISPVLFMPGDFVNAISFVVISTCGLRRKRDNLPA